MTAFLTKKNKEFSSDFFCAKEKAHNDDWSLPCSEMLFIYGDLWHKSFNFYICAPFANFLDVFYIFDFFDFLYQTMTDLADIFKYSVFAILSPFKAICNLATGNIEDFKISLYQALQSAEKVILSVIDLAINILFFALSPIARIFASFIWYLMTPPSNARPSELDFNP